MSILVIGSLNMDLVVTTGRRPKGGETVTGSSFNIYPGGKGANQAVAAARTGARVYMAGRLGQDDFSAALLENLKSSGVGVDWVSRSQGVSTGCAIITVDDTGENSIIVVPGANALVSSHDVDMVFQQIPTVAAPCFHYVLLQLEIPLPSVFRAVELANEKGIPVILDPAPFPKGKGHIPSEILRNVDILLPNEHEASAITGLNVYNVDSAIAAAQRLAKMGVRNVVITLGELGVVLGSGGLVRHVSGFSVDAVDTTGAGDTFAGALAAFLMEGHSLERACVFANAAAALSVTKEGAQPSIPHRSSVDAFLKEAVGGHIDVTDFN